jgi:hypothetical protein
MRLTSDGHANQIRSSGLNARRWMPPSDNQAGYAPLL